MTKEQRKQIEKLIDSGIMREYIAAYFVCTLYSMNMTKEKTRLGRGLLLSIMGDTPAAAALELAKKLLPGD